MPDKKSTNKQKSKLCWQTQYKNVSVLSCFFVFPDEHIWTAVYQLDQREAPAILQSPHVHSWTRRVQEGGDWMGLHQLWVGLGAHYQPHWEGR